MSCEFDHTKTDPSTEKKVVALDRLLTLVADWHRKGQVVVFTNGCFDLLHVGHIELLERCRRLGDKVVVAVNSDFSVRQIKGPSRPLVAERDRARLLAALVATDAIVTFDELTPLHLILRIQPDVLVKGGDYSESTIVGAAEVKARGGRVEIVPLLDGFSTTSILTKLKD